MYLSPCFKQCYVTLYMHIVFFLPAILLVITLLNKSWSLSFPLSTGKYFIYSQALHNSFLSIMVHLYDGDYI